jgi:phenylalanyl-tRNA synthetase alpha chain
MATTEDLQTLVLTTLDKTNVIQDSKDLTFNGAAVDQLALLGALNSLKSKEVQEIHDFYRHYTEYTYCFSFLDD